MRRAIPAALAASLLLSACKTAPEHDVQALDQLVLDQQARAEIQAFAGALKGTLQGAMQAGGPVAAIQACNLQAPGIARQASRNGWTVGRTSLKLRNPANQPDQWERQMLERFAERAAQGEPVANLQASRIEGNTYRYMHAIKTGGLCLVCHGASPAENVADKLHSLYPQDQARGYQVGDLRGAFTLIKQLDK